MALTVIPGAMPITGKSLQTTAGISVADQIVGSPGGWTPGATAIMSILPTVGGPGLASPWRILGWSLEYQLYSFVTAAGQPFGKLGRVLAGLVKGTGVTATLGIPGPPVPGVPWTAPIQAPPQDQSAIQTLFDGGNDPAPPAAPVNLVPYHLSQLGPQDWRTFGFQLPVPITLQAGDQLGFGIWLTPSLAQNACLAVMNANYSLQVEL